MFDGTAATTPNIRRITHKFRLDTHPAASLQSPSIISMEFFRKTFSGIFGAARVSLDQSRTAFYAANEVWEANQMAMAVTNWTTFQTKPRWNSTGRKRTKKKRKQRAAGRGNPHESSHQSMILRGTPASLFIQTHDAALAEASLACSMPESPSELILWVDGSVGPFGDASFAGYASVFKRAGSWVRMVSRRVAPRQGSNSTELRAIELGLNFALQVATGVNMGAGKLRVVKVFTDSLCSIQGLVELQVLFFHGKMPRQRFKKRPEFFELLQIVAQMTRSLEQAGVRAELHWVPRNRVEGNIVADKAAGVARLSESLTSSDLVQLDWDLEAEAQIGKAETVGYESRSCIGICCCEHGTDGVCRGLRRRLLVSNKVMAETVGLYLPQMREDEM
ncbi:hypothetical protein EDB81DRAFT_779571 [Dactylonectria macrodidyma]|uniref:RNase H type-1 domain-containing protein n=1 Tax=Dactylonectria macrodidyma TaxID=307937 RepID=A0A9P9JMF1_9HYPO|nr:hypothetical protein EDB81DRAFT_779571 [Dactylonectria macrodidyma]